MSRRFAHLDENERQHFYKRLVEKFTGATVVFTRGNPQMSSEEVFFEIVKEISQGAYRRLFEDLPSRNVDLLVLPEFVPELYSGNQELYDPKSSIVETSISVMHRIMVDTEEYSLWDAVVLFGENNQLPERLLAQRRRILSYFESLSFAQ